MAHLCANSGHLLAWCCACPALCHLVVFCPPSGSLHSAAPRHAGLRPAHRRSEWSKASCTKMKCGFGFGHAKHSCTGWAKTTFSPACLTLHFHLGVQKCVPSGIYLQMCCRTKNDTKDLSLSYWSINRITTVSSPKCSSCPFLLSCPNCYFWWWLLFINPASLNYKVLKKNKCCETSRAGIVSFLPTARSVVA